MKFKTIKSLLTEEVFVSLRNNVKRLPYYSLLCSNYLFPAEYKICLCFNDEILHICVCIGMGKPEHWNVIFSTKCRIKNAHTQISNASFFSSTESNDNFMIQYFTRSPVDKQATFKIFN